MTIHLRTSKQSVKSHLHFLLSNALPEGSISFYSHADSWCLITTNDLWDSIVSWQRG